MSDREDAGVLAGALVGGADFRVTDNLRDFENKEAAVFDTQQPILPDGQMRQLSAVLHRRPDGATVIVAHPFDFLQWVREGRELSATMVRSSYAERSPGAGRSRRKNCGTLPAEILDLAEVSRLFARIGAVNLNDKVNDSVNRFSRSRPQLILACH